MSSDEIREVRDRLQMTQEEFAAALGVSFATVNRWENGHAEPGAYRVNQMRQLRAAHYPAAKEIDLWTGRLAIAIGQGRFREEVATMITELRRTKR